MSRAFGPAAGPTGRLASSAAARRPAGPPGGCPQPQLAPTRPESAAWAARRPAVAPAARLLGPPQRRGLPRRLRRPGKAARIWEQPLPPMPDGGEVARHPEAEYCHAVYGVDLTLDEHARRVRRRRRSRPPRRLGPATRDRAPTRLAAPEGPLNRPSPPRSAAWGHRKGRGVFRWCRRFQARPRLADRDPDQAADGLLVPAGATAPDRARSRADLSLRPPATSPGLPLVPPRTSA